MKTILTAFISGLLSVIAQASPAQYSKILCSAEGAQGLKVTSTFESVDGTDLTNPSGKSVFLLINGEKEPVEFQVSVVQTITGFIFDYSYRNPFFVSDIALHVKNSSNVEKPLVSGTWAVDYPPVQNLDCHFLN